MHVYWLKADALLGGPFLPYEHLLEHISTMITTKLNVKAEAQKLLMKTTTTIVSSTAQLKLIL